MTGKRRAIGIEAIAASFGSSVLGLDMRKSNRGAIAVLNGIVSIKDCNHERIELLSHSGRVVLEGECLEISVLENRTVEIYGRITEVRLSYGKA